MATRTAGEGTTGETVALGFGTSVAMWSVGYLCRIPPAVVPSWLLAAALLGCLLAGGVLAGRLTGRRWRAGMAVGLFSSVVNLLILGSLLGGPHPNQIVPSALWWLPGSVVLGAALGAAGGAAAGTIRGRAPDWTEVLAIVASAATLLQLLVGGIVTGAAAGLAVVDWPNSFGYNMFLYPLSRMTGGVYFEHAHRLFGTLVGLTTLVLAIHLLRVEERSWVKRLGLVALGVVIVQGILGGLRVTGTFTFSTSHAAMEPSMTLAIAHGVLGPTFFGLMVALAVFLSPTWKGDGAPAPARGAGSERILGVVVTAAVLLQLVLGGIQRHLERGLLVHITFAAVVLALAALYGARLWGLYQERPLLGRLGRLLAVVALVQVVLGVVALFAQQATVAGAPPTTWAVLLTTAHQAGGSVLLGCAVMAALWPRRLLVQAV